MAQQVSSQGSDIIRDSVANAIESVVHALEPQIHEFASKAAVQAVDRSRDVAQAAYRAARRQPWYLVGAAALLLVGAAILFRFTEQEWSSDARLSGGFNA